jgi:hypothetical protein
MTSKRSSRVAIEVCEPRVGVSYVTVMVISLLVCQQIGRGMRGSGIPVSFHSWDLYTTVVVKIRWSHNYVIKKG